MLTDCLQNIPVGISIHEFSAIASLPVGSTKQVTLGVDYGDSTQSISFDIVASGRPVKINLRPSVGELIRPVDCTEGYFMNEQGFFLLYSLPPFSSSQFIQTSYYQCKFMAVMLLPSVFIAGTWRWLMFRIFFAGKLRGMNENSATLSSRFDQSDVKSISSKLFRAANVASIISSDPLTLR